MKTPPPGLTRNPYPFDWHTPEPPSPYRRCLTQARYSYRGPGVIPTGPHEIACISVRVEVKRAPGYTGPGLRHLHEFSLIHRASLQGYGDLADMRIDHEHQVEHRVNGELVRTFGWGHCSVKLYQSVHVWLGPDQAYDGELLGGYNLLPHDLPCCGGRYASDREITDYSTLSIGHCLSCGCRWEIVDGLHFRPARRSL